MIQRALIFVLAFCTSASAADPAGVLSLVSGTVQIIRDGEKAPRKAQIADLIMPGDHIVTAGQSEASFLFCPESRAAKILADSEVQFEAGTVRVLKGKLADDRKVSACKLPSNLALSGSSQLQSGVLRLRGSNLVLVSPSKTNVAHLQPRFRWEPMDGATAYELKITDREERVLWKQKFRSGDAQYPSNAPALAWDQKYLWRVTALDGEEPLTEVGSYFQTLPKDRADQVRSVEDATKRFLQSDPKDGNSLLLLAFLYDENGILDEAARTYREITQKIGPSEWIQGRLIEIANKLGWEKLDSARP